MAIADAVVFGFGSDLQTFRSSNTCIVSLVDNAGEIRAEDVFVGGPSRVSLPKDGAIVTSIRKRWLIISPQHPAVKLQPYTGCNLGTMLPLPDPNQMTAVRMLPLQCPYCRG